jgi:hypothetical protein
MLCVGRTNCLAFALEHNCPVEDSVLDAAVTNGHLECVELLVARGLPHRPYLPAPTNDRVTFSGGTLGDRQLQCLEHLFVKGCPVHPGILISAAMRGDFDAVRYLHSRGVPLWHHAWENTADKIGFPKGLCWKSSPGPRGYCFRNRILVIPPVPNISPDMWEVLRYGFARRAPLTPVLEEALANRASTCALLLSFHAAARLSQREGTREPRPASGTCQGEGTWGERAACSTHQEESTRDNRPGSGSCRGEGPQDARLALGTCQEEGTGDNRPEEGSCRGEGTQDARLALGMCRGEGIRGQKAAWAPIGRVPMELVEKITVLAGFEDPQTFHYGLATACCLLWSERPLATRLFAWNPFVPSKRAFVDEGWWEYDGKVFMF